MELELIISNIWIVGAILEKDLRQSFIMLVLAILWFIGAWI